MALLNDPVIGQSETVLRMPGLKHPLEHFLFLLSNLTLLFTVSTKPLQMLGIHQQSISLCTNKTYKVLPKNCLVLNLNIS